MQSELTHYALEHHGVRAIDFVGEWIGMSDKPELPRHERYRINCPAGKDDGHGDQLGQCP